QLAAVEAHAVDVLRLLALAVGVGVRKDEDAVDSVDNATPPARVAGQAGGSLRGGAARYHPRAQPPGGRRGRRPPERSGGGAAGGRRGGGRRRAGAAPAKE